MSGFLRLSLAETCPFLYMSALRHGELPGVAQIEGIIETSSGIRHVEDEDEEDWPGAGGRLQAPTRGQLTVGVAAAVAGLHDPSPQRAGRRNAIRLVSPITYGQLARRSRI